MIKLGVQLSLRSVISGFVKLPPVSQNKKRNALLNFQPLRCTGFFNRLTQEQLWKGVVSVSNAGKRRGRGKGADRKGKRDLNIGQRMGFGKEQISWPGLSSSILGSSGITKIKKHSEPQKPVEAGVPPRHKIRKYKATHPLERGWSGKQTRGKKIGPPDAVEDETFEDFESIVLDMRLKVQMSSILGRKRFFTSIVATGNGNGLVGVGVAKSLDSKSCINLAKNRASRRLHTIDLIEKHTVNHNFFSEFGRTRVTVLKKPKGYGLRCHRIIIALCKLIGIEDLYARVKGPATAKNVIRAFIVGLLKQKTYQEIADEKKLHLVEFKEETFNFPSVLASPEKCLRVAEARKDTSPFEEYIMGGRLLEDKGPRQPFWIKLPSWKRHLKKTLYSRNHDQVKIDLHMKYGTYNSHLTKVYPECTNSAKLQKKSNSEAE